MPAVAYNANTHKILYHHLDSPADYQYDPVANTWTLLTSSGGGSTLATTPQGQTITYDSTNNLLIGWNQGTSADLWIGALSSGGAANACDVNRDGTVNVLDLQIGVNQAIGLAACGTADIDGNGVCTIVDVQRLSNASLGAACRTGL